MSSTCGENIKVTVFGQSHSAAIGMTLEGVPAGESIDMEELRAFLRRRAPGRNAWSTARKEEDIPEFLAGLKGGVSCGTPITAIIRNTDARPGDYEALRNVPRPGHADYTAFVKYGESADFSGGGHFSGRLTAALCIAGGICIQILRRGGVEIISRIAQTGPVKDRGELLSSTAENAFPTVNKDSGLEMQGYIASCKADGDSAGGIIECKVLGLPAGLGDPMFDGMENRIARLVFGIPACKGIEFGAGFGAALLRGSENNDPFDIEDGRIITKTNNCGGILGGITDGMPLVFRAAFKPTPSIAREQESVDLSTMEKEILKVSGRHDPCIVPRAVPVVEAAAALAVYDAYLSRGKEER